MNKKDTFLLSLLVVATTVSLAVTYKLTVLQQSFGGLDFAALSSPICSDETPTIFGLIDFDSAPGLLFYAYLPMAAVSVVLALLLLRNRHRSQKSVVLAASLSFFVLWVACILLTWMASYHVALMFAWQIIGIFEVGLYLTAFYFAYLTVSDRDLPYWAKCVLSLVGLTVIALTPTVLNIAVYDPEICEGVEGPLWPALYYGVQPAVILAVIGAGIAAVRGEKSPTRRRQIGLFTAGFAFFLAAFAASNSIGSFTGTYELNFWGPLGLVVSFLMAGYMLMQRLAYHWHTIAAEFLVWGLVTLIGMQFFYISDTVPFVLNSLAFLMTIVFGMMMIRSATVEIRQKETEISLQRQRETIEQLTASRLKDALTRSKFYFNEIGGNAMSPNDVRQKAQQGHALCEDGLSAISQVQKALGLRTKSVTLDLNSVDLRSVVAAAAETKKAEALKKGLQLTTEIEEGPFMLLGDSLWLGEMANAFMDNAVRYTSTGGVTVGLRKQAGKALFWIRDTGIGIPEADMPLLFTEAGHGSNVAALNPGSLGFGLYIAKLVIDAHRGRAWAQSKPGQGTTFFVELPLL